MGKPTFKIATKEDISGFMAKAILNPDIYPYLTVTKHLGNREPDDTDWHSITFVDNELDVYGKIDINRACDNGFNVSLYGTNPYKVGRAFKFIEDLIRRYDPMYIETVVHASNEKSIKINKKIFGEPWGVEPKGAWNMLKGEYEDLLHFRKNLK